MKDKREFTRVAAKATVWIIKDGKRYCHITGDVSLGGIKISSVQPYKEGDILDIEFSIPDSGLKYPVFCKIAVSKITSKDGTYFLHCYFFDIAAKDQDRFSDAVNNLIVDAWFLDENPVKSKDVLYKNQREQSRVPLKMWINSKDIDDNVYLPAQNVSTGGLYLITPAKHEPGTVLEIAFNIPSKKKLIEAVVVVENIRKEGSLYGLGVKFIDLNEQDRQILQSLITADLTTKWYLK
jgi:uncharacterized C2H2 Zn-finger protein